MSRLQDKLSPVSPCILMHAKNDCCHLEEQSYPVDLSRIRKQQDNGENNIGDYMPLNERTIEDNQQLHPQLKIHQEILHTQKEINKLLALKHRIQEDCTHPDVKKIAKSSTGHYDPSDDMYWYECSCPDCLKQWREPQ